MKTLMIDSNVIIDLLRNRRKALGRIQRFSQYKLVVSHFSYIEVMAGAQSHRKADTEKFFRQYLVLSFNNKAQIESRSLARRYHAGKPLDLLIAAHAKAEGVELLTNNVKDFAKYKGLKVLHYEIPT